MKTITENNLGRVWERVAQYVKTITVDVNVGKDGTLLHQIQTKSVTTDAELSTTSENPIQNKAVAAAIGNINTILDEINGEVV